MSVLMTREVFGALPSNCVKCTLVTFPLTLQPLRGASLGCTSGGKQSGPWSALSSPARALRGLAPGCVGLCPQEGWPWSPGPPPVLSTAVPTSSTCAWAAAAS